MLTNLRERSQRSFGVLILFGMLTFIFIFFFGPQSEGCQPQQANVSLDGWAARINGVELSRREVEEFGLPRGNRRTDDELASLRQDVLVGLIDQELLAQQRLRLASISMKKDCHDTSQATRIPISLLLLMMRQATSIETVFVMPYVIALGSVLRTIELGSVGNFSRISIDGLWRSRFRFRTLRYALR